MVYLKTRCEHASRDYKIRYHETGHTEGQEDGLSSVCLSQSCHDIRSN